MAIYHLRIFTIGRRNAQNAVAWAAECSGTALTDAHSGVLVDSCKRTGIELAEILVPHTCERRDIAWALDRERLWNAVEEAETRGNSRLVRVYEVGLPHELSQSQRVALTRDYAQELANRYGVVVDVVVHAPPTEGDARNFFGLISTTTRELTAAGFGAKAPLEITDALRAARGLPPGRSEIIGLRKRWADVCNLALQRAGRPERIDHRTLAAQGSDHASTRPNQPWR
jgi:ATP-dependent exoDNAse (exonuclease V) alpha subunit